MHLCTPIPSEMLAFELNADDAGRSAYSLARRTQRLWFPTRMSNLDSSDNRTLFHFETVHFKWALAHRTRRRFGTMFTYGFLFAWYSFSWHLQMARWIVFTVSGFWKYSWAHLVMSMKNHADEWCSVVWGPEDHGHPTKVFGLVPYAQRFSPVSLNLLMMLCTVDDEIWKAFAIWHWGTLFFKVFHNLFTHSFTDWRASASLRHPFMLQTWCQLT